MDLSKPKTPSTPRDPEVKVPVLVMTLNGLEDASKGCSHCRDAPWDVSEAEKTIQWGPARPRGVREITADVTAPETPHGASLQWGRLLGIDRQPSQAYA
jgi:hypothetical protein